MCDMSLAMPQEVVDVLLIEDQALAAGQGCDAEPPPRRPPLPRPVDSLKRHAPWLGSAPKVAAIRVQRARLPRRGGAAYGSETLQKQLQKHGKP